MKIFVKNDRLSVERVIKSLVLYGALSIRAYEKDPLTACVEIGRDDLLFSFSSFEEADGFVKELAMCNDGLISEYGAAPEGTGMVVRVRDVNGGGT